MCHAGRKGREVGRSWPAQHVRDEQSVPCGRGDEPDRRSVARIRAGVYVQHEQVAIVQMPGDVLAEARELVRLHRLIDRTPRHALARPGLPDDELVARAAAGVRRRHHAERPTLRRDSLAAAQGMSVQFGGRGVPVQRPPRCEAGIAEPCHCGGGTTVGGVW